MEGTRGAESPLRWAIKWYPGGHAECIRTRAAHHACSKPIVRSAAKGLKAFRTMLMGLHDELGGAVVSAEERRVGGWWPSVATLALGTFPTLVMQVNCNAAPVPH